MFDSPFSFHLITPDRTLYEGEACCVTAPGVEGSFQILRNHAPLLSALDIGKITVRDSSGGIRVFAASGGFLEVKKNDCTLLAEAAELAEGIDVDRARNAMERAERDIITEKSEKIDTSQARSALRRARNRIAVANRKLS